MRNGGVLILALEVADVCSGSTNELLGESNTDFMTSHPSSSCALPLQRQPGRPIHRPRSMPKHASRRHHHHRCLRSPPYSPSSARTAASAATVAASSVSNRRPPSPSPSDPPAPSDPPLPTSPARLLPPPPPRRRAAAAAAARASAGARSPDRTTCRAHAGLGCRVCGPHPVGAGAHACRRRTRERTLVS